MRTLFEVHPWKVIETELHREQMRLAESLTSLGNARFGMRGNFEEAYSGDCHRGTYLAGVWFPDKTRVGWWKNGYPDYFGKVINAANLIEIGVWIDGIALDLNRAEVLSFYRELDMQRGVLIRRASIAMKKGIVHVEVERFLSIARREMLAISYRVMPQFDAEIAFMPALDGNVRNEDANYDEMFWENMHASFEGPVGTLVMRTRENPFGTPRFSACASMHIEDADEPIAANGRVGCCVRHRVPAGGAASLVKLVAVDTSRYHDSDSLLQAHVLAVLEEAVACGYDALRREHCDAWRARWEQMDVVIDNDDSMQQGIRFNLFQMLCTYDGHDPRLNIGPKGFTGEKYGGATYWDTEMFVLPMILSALGEEAGRSLLMYRYLHLDKAKENAKKLGCSGALYPMVTFNGEECHNEWEITFEEIHRNAAMVYAIFMEHEYNGTDAHMQAYGFPVMLEICRYFLSRMSYSERKRSYMILGVTGPNEYENNVQNNWYTNRMAKFCLEQTAHYARTVIGMQVIKKYGSGEREVARFERIAKRIYLPEDKRLGIFLQQDGFLDKEIAPASSIPEAERPICQHWSWDRILRSCYIKQADVLQGLYCLRHVYDEDTIRRNFDFYEPLTVHESSLSPCIHAILAADLRLYDKAVEMYGRTARLDLDNMNNDTEDGLHITSMAGSWMAIVKGFAGVRTENGCLEIAPHVPYAFRSFLFRMKMQGRVIEVAVRDGMLRLTLHSGAPLMVKVYDTWLTLSPGEVRFSKIVHMEVPPEE